MDRAGRPRPSILHSIAHSLWGAGAARVFGAVGGLLAARALGPDQRGSYAVLLLMGLGASLFVSGGLQFWVARSAAAGEGRRPMAVLVMSQTGVALALVTVAVVAGGALVTPWLDVTWAATWWTGAYAVTNTVGLLLLAAPNGVRDMRLVAWAVTGGAAAFAGAVGVAAVSGRATVGVVLAAGVLGNVVTAVVAAAGWRRLPAGAGGLSARAWSGALRSSLPAGLGELVLLAMFRVDVVVVAAFLPLEEVGLYAVATSYTELLWVLPDAIGQVSLPLAVEERTGRATARLARLTVVAMLVSGLALSLASPLLLPWLFGSAFRGAVAAVPFLALAGAGAAVWKILGGDVVAHGRGSARLWTAGTGLAVMVAVDVALVPVAGIVGASVGAAVAYAVAGLAMGWVWQRAADRSGRWWRWQRGDLVVLRGIVPQARGPEAGG